MKALPVPRLGAAWAQVRYAPGRVLSTIVAVALGVALASGLLLVAEDLPAALEASVEAVVGRADLQVVATSGAGLDEELLGRIAAVPGVAVAAPVVTVPSFFDDDTAEQLTVWGIDLLNESALSLYGMAAGGAGVELGDPLSFASQLDSVIAPAGLLRRRGIQKGATVSLVTPSGVRSLVIRAVFDDGGSARANATDLLVMDVYSAQILFDMAGRFTHVDVLLEEGADLASVRGKLADVVGEAASVAPAGAHATAARSMLEGAQLLIRAMSLSGIVLAILLTFNRLSTVFFARQWEVGVSRALGASPRAATLELLKEALIIGTIGALLGTAAATAFARSVAPLVAEIAEFALGSGVPAFEVSVRPGLLAVGATLGLLATLAGALLPAREAGRAPVVAALRGRGLEEMASGGQGAPKLGAWAAPVLLTGISAALLWLESRTHTAAAGFAAMVILIVTVSLLARPALDLLVGPLTRSLTWLGGPIGRLAVRDLARSPRRAAGAVRLIAIGLGIVVFFQILATSLQFSNARIMAGSRRADLIVASAYDIGSETALLSESILDDLRQIPGVAAVGGERGLFGPDFGLSAFDSLQLRDPRLVAWASEGRLSADALERVAAGQAVLVSAGYAAHHGVEVGSEVELTSPVGPVRLPVAGVAAASAYSNKGDVIIARETYRRFWKDSAITRAHVAIAPGESVDAVRSRILRTLGGHHRLHVFTTPELVEHYEDVVRRGAVIIQPMSLIALIVVLLGIGDALLAAVFERSRELGTMRALGATPRSVAGFVVAQAVAICLLGAVLAPALALALSFALLEVTSISVLGWRSEVVLARTTTAVVLASGIVAALASAALPAWRATRVAPADALRAE